MPKRIWTEANAGAEFSPCRQYRYSLYRNLSHVVGRPKVCSFIGLNPSTADETNDDPTVARCWKYAERWGYDVFYMLNLHPYLATKPREMKRHETPLHALVRNLNVAQRICVQSDIVVCAWGTHGRFNGLEYQMMSFLPSIKSNVYCLGKNQDGTPKHPLYLKSDAERVPMF